MGDSDITGKARQRVVLKFATKSTIKP